MISTPEPNKQDRSQQAKERNHTMTNDNMQDRLERFDARGEITLDDTARKVLRGQYARRVTHKDTAQDEYMAYHQSAEAQIHLPVPREGEDWLAA